jgi:O-acetyl-ADP-ribose deacetylase (regulator of RNase III)
MPFTIVRQDITKIKVDAIVNAANTDLAMGSGVCGAIFKAAGASDLQEACDKLAPIQTGNAVITPGFRLPAKFVIHTAGPVYHGGKSGEEAQLHSCYLNSLKRALENKCESIAFPLISSGIYGYPKDEALRVATTAIKDFLGEHELDVYLAVFDKAAFEISEKLLGEVESYIDEHYVAEHRLSRRELLDVEREALEEADLIKYNAPASMQASIVGTGIDDLYITERVFNIEG